MFRIAIKNEPLHAGAHVNLACAIMADPRGDVRRADALLRRVLSFSPLSTGTSPKTTAFAARIRAYLFDGYGTRADEYPERRNATRAIDAYRFALTLDSNNDALRQRLAVLLAETGRVREASSMLASDRERARVMFAAAAKAREEDRWDDAETYYRNVLRALLPDGTVSSNAIPSDEDDAKLATHVADALGSRLVSTGRYDDALLMYDLAVRLDSSDARLWNNRGHIRLRLGRIEEAESDVRTSLEIRPAYPSALANMKSIVEYKRASGFGTETEPGLGS